MSSVIQLRICFISTCSNTLLHLNDQHLKLIKAAVITKRPASPWRPFRPRRQAAPATPFVVRRRRSYSAPAVHYPPDCLQQVSHSFALSKVASRQYVSRRRSPSARREAECSLVRDINNASMDEFEQKAASSPMPHVVSDSAGDVEIKRASMSGKMPPPPPRASFDEMDDTRSSRASSSASRNTNRLSLTLPIAPPTSNPSRPTPTSSHMSYPPTPVEGPSLTASADPNDLIIAIAAQERRILELREELSRAEGELTRLKKHWSSNEGHRKRGEARKAELVRPLASTAVSSPVEIPAQQPDGTVSRNSAELERRKAVLLAQQGDLSPGTPSTPGTPGQSRRKVFRGGHTRTLSLLSPAKSIEGFTVHEEPTGLPKPPMKDSEPQFQNLGRHAQATALQLSKRASWAPRSVHQNGVKQIAEDFKAGLWTFVEDLRQATVGDEPIHGAGNATRLSDGLHRSSSLIESSTSGDQDTIRTSTQASRTHISRVFDEFTPTPSSRFGDPLDAEASSATKHKRNATVAETISSKAGAKTKRFSWTPLTVDSYDDNDWSSWDSPTVKSPRWSGTTVNGDIIPTIPEKVDENDVALKKQTSVEQSGAPSSPPRLEEMPFAVLNRLTPSNLKKHASNFMKEWEESLSPPAESISEILTGAAIKQKDH